MNMHLADIFWGLLFILPPIVFFLFKKYIVAYIVQKVEFSFDKKLEKLSSDLRKAENRDSCLRELIKDFILKDNVEVRAQRIEAINKLWECFIKMKKYAYLASYIPEFHSTDHVRIETFINFSRDVDVQFLEQGSLDSKMCRIWVSLTAWITFGAYEYILLYIIEYATVLESNIELNLGDEKCQVRSIKVINEMLHNIFNEPEFAALSCYNVTHANLHLWLTLLEMKLAADLLPQKLSATEQSEKIESIKDLAKKAGVVFDDI